MLREDDWLANSPEVVRLSLDGQVIESLLELHVDNKGDAHVQRTVRDDASVLRTVRGDAVFTRTVL